ncbi:MAG: hypothetical protein HY901_03010 [Deltaproteobacteria bacterium]|nr:hypothetical protein [Deltaproteobacteria bacterium]
MLKTTASITAVLALALTAVPAAGQDETPWAKGVSPEQQKTALAIFREGNASLKEGVFTDAAQKYRDALSHWDHPAIHYNLVLALRTLDQPLEMHQHLLAAMRFGPEPLDAAKYENALLLRDLVEKQLARVQVRCDEVGAQVVMDGKQLFTAPGRFDDFVRPGPHTIVATKSGFLTHQLSKPMPAGQVSAFDIKLFKASDLTRYKRRWSVAIPWAVVAGGAVVTLAGGGLHYGAKVSFEDYDRIVESQGGSLPTEELTSKRSQGEVMQGTAIGCYALGGAVLVTGAVLVYLNRLIPYQETSPAGPIDPKKPKQEAPTWGMAPLIGSDAQGVAAYIRF